MSLEAQQYNTQQEIQGQNMKEKLNQLQNEISELTDDKTDNDEIEGLSNFLTNEFSEYLKTQPNTLNSLFESCKDYKNKNPDVKDTGFDNLYMFLNGARKECAEIGANNIKVTLRGERWRNLEGEELNNEKQKIAEELNGYVKMRDVLPAEIQELLMLTKAALESESHDDGEGNPVSDEVYALENKLVDVGAMQHEAHDGKNNGVDGKFGHHIWKAVGAYFRKRGNKIEKIEKF